MLFTGVLLLVENNSEPVVQVSLDASYVQINNAKYALRDFESFAVIEMEGVPLYLRFFPKKRLSPLLEIPLTELVDIAELRSFLSERLPENEDSHFSHTDTLIRRTNIHPRALAHRLKPFENLNII